MSSTLSRGRVAPSTDSEVNLTTTTHHCNYCCCCHFKKKLQNFKKSTRCFFNTTTQPTLLQPKKWLFFCLPRQSFLFNFSFHSAHTRILQQQANNRPTTGLTGNSMKESANPFPSRTLALMSGCASRIFTTSKWPQSETMWRTVCCLPSWYQVQDYPSNSDWTSATSPTICVHSAISFPQCRCRSSFGIKGRKGKKGLKKKEQAKKKKKEVRLSTASSIPGWSPSPVLTRPSRAWLPWAGRVRVHSRVCGRRHHTTHSTRLL